MRTITLFLFAALAVTSIDAASYKQTDGTIVDPILDVHGNVLSYSGNNLRPWANLEPLANLSYANLTYANLNYANLNYVNLEPREPDQRGPGPRVPAGIIPGLGGPGQREPDRREPDRRGAV